MSTNKEVAKRLLDFVAEAEARRVASDLGFQTQVTTSPSPPSKTLEEICEKCLEGALTDPEHAELDRMIEKMRRALASPRGARP
jgi:hypothetical protein